MLSWLVLIDREFNPINLIDTMLSCFQRIISLYLIGDDSEVDTPVPISNTAVKHFSADDSVSENKTLPVFLCNKKESINDSFF